MAEEEEEEDVMQAYAEAVEFSLGSDSNEINSAPQPAHWHRPTSNRGKRWKDLTKNFSSIHICVGNVSDVSDNLWLTSLNMQKPCLFLQLLQWLLPVVAWINILFDSRHNFL